MKENSYQILETAQYYKTYKGFFNSIALNNTKEYEYFLDARDTYIRTIDDILNYSQTLSKNRENIKILEIGSFLGIVAVSLAKLNFDVTGFDIPEIMNDNEISHFYQLNSVKTISSYLDEGQLHIDAQSFDIVILCEVIEHLNFNHFKLLFEINRILKSAGLLYIALPNLTRLGNRIRMFLGKSIHSKIDDYYEGINNKARFAMIHHKEYTKKEIIQSLKLSNFEVIKHYYDASGMSRKRSFRTIFEKIIYLIFPFLRYHMVVFAKKK